MINHVVLSEDGTSVGMYIGSGKGLVDSTTVDSEGNVYQAIYDAGRAMIYSKYGDLIGIVTVPANFDKPQTLSANVAIMRGTTDGFITVGGESGGYIYHFEALATGGEQSNDG